MSDCNDPSDNFAAWRNCTRKDCCDPRPRGGDVNTATMTVSTTASWNGPVCQTCRKPYLGTHTCQASDLINEAKRLLDLAARLSGAAPQITQDRTATCPCRPENGGSGICGCIYGGVQITC